MSSSAEQFNKSSFSQFINSKAGRILRLIAGLGFLLIGYSFRTKTLGIISMVWSIFPLSAGIFDLCFISALLGGPISGAMIRKKFGKETILKEA